MLTAVIEEYLGRLKSERAFDATFLALLAELGYEDIHCTHGPTEKGKDFIAKKANGDHVVQWVFQSKCGDVKTTDWKNELIGQLYSCEFVGLEHSAFNGEIERQTVLVTTGTVNLPVNNQLDSFNKDTLKKVGKNAVKVWDQGVLAELLATRYSSSLHTLSSQSIRSYGKFYELLGKAAMGDLLLWELEVHSRQWCVEADSAFGSILSCTLELSLIADRAMESMCAYESMYCHCGILRTVLWHLYNMREGAERLWCLEFVSSLLGEIHTCAKTFVDQTVGDSEASGLDLIASLRGEATIVTYPVVCSRLIECLAICYWLDTSPVERSRIVDFMVSVIEKEPGATRPISDSFAISISLAFLVLHDAGRTGVAQKLVERCAVWLCDRYEDGVGIGELAETPLQVVERLLCDPGSFPDRLRRGGSLIASVLCDAASFGGYARLYEDVVNDFVATGVSCEYYQCRDNLSQFELHSPDVDFVPALPFPYSWSEMAPVVDSRFASPEMRKFGLVESVGVAAYLCLSCFLRDRYWPKLWSGLITG